MSDPAVVSNPCVVLDNLVLLHNDRVLWHGTRVRGFAVGTTPAALYEPLLDTPVATRECPQHWPVATAHARAAAMADNAAVLEAFPRRGSGPLVVELGNGRLQCFRLA